MADDVMVMGPTASVSVGPVIVLESEGPGGGLTPEQEELLESAMQPGDGAGGGLSGSYPNPGLNESAVHALILAYLAAGNGVNIAVVDGELTISVTALAITSSSVVADEAEMLALDAQEGDVAIRTDTQSNWILGSGPATTLGSWQQLLTPAGAVLSVAGKTGVVTLSIADTTGLQTALDGKATAAQGAKADTAIQGPEGATEDHIFVAADTTGHALKDSGVEIGSLATKAEVAAREIQPIGSARPIPISTAESSAAAVGTHSFVGGGSTYLYGVLFTTLINSAFAWDVYLESGTWVIDWMYAKTNSGGIITPSIDGVTATPVDTYNGGIVANVIASSSIVVTSTGVKTVKFQCLAKNASSSAYDMRVQNIVLRKVPSALVGGGGGLAAPESSVSGSGQDMLLWRSATHSTASAPVTLVIYCHGANGLAAHAGTNSTHNKVTAAMLAKGWMVAASEQHGNNWGNNAALSDIVDLYAWVTATYGVANVVLWGASMGGLSAWNAVKNNTVTGIIGAVGSSPVCSLADMHANSGWTGSIRSAYSVASDGSDFTSKTAGHDPLLEPASTWNGKKLRAYASPDDTSVNRAANATPFIAIADDTASTAVLVSTTGSHGDASNYPPSAIVAWITSIGGTP